MDKTLPSDVNANSYAYRGTVEGREGVGRGGKGGGEGWTEKAVILQASFRALIISSSKYF